jgi:hypothetical protein
MSIDVADLVYNTDDRVHCADSGSFGFGKIHTIDLSNGSVIDNMAYADGPIRIQPGGLSMYSASLAGSPTRLTHLDISTSPVSWVNSSSSVQHEYGRNVWFTDDGATIIGASRTLFHASSDPALDMTFEGELVGTATTLDITWAVHSVTVGRIATLGVDYDSTFTNVVGYFLRTYDDQQFALQQTIQLPSQHVGGISYPSEGRFAAYNPSGTKVYVIGRAMVGGAPVNAVYAITP